MGELTLTKFMIVSTTPLHLITLSYFLALSTGAHPPSLMSVLA